MGVAMFIDGETLPLDADSEQGHGGGQAHGEIAPGALARVRGMADLREQGEGGLDAHAVVPGAARADLQIGRIALLAPACRVGEDDHARGEAGDKRVEGAVVDVGGVRAPGADHPPRGEDHAARAADDPAVVGHARAPAAGEPTPALLAVR